MISITTTESFSSFGRVVTVASLLNAKTITTTTTSNQQQLIGLKMFPQQQQEIQHVETPFLTSVIDHWTPADATALIHALVASFSVILVSELGDKTFIITAIMAMKNSRGLVFLASAMALFLMTVLSVGMGVAVTVIPDVYTHYASIVLFLCFGLKLLAEAYLMKDENEEFDEVERSLKEEDEKKLQEQQQVKDENLFSIEANTPLSSTKDINNNDIDSSTPQKSRFSDQLARTIHIAPVLIKVFTMILVAEWGDRSQISTIVLAAREDVTGVFVGSFVGHLLCTGLAVIGGRFVADLISVRTITLLGGIIFLIFAAFEIITGPDMTH